MIDSIRPFRNDSLQCLHKQENKNKIICLLKMIFNKHFNAVIENRIFRHGYLKFIAKTENYNKPNNPHFCH